MNGVKNSLLCFFVLLLTGCMTIKNKEITFFYPTAPYSSDPLEYDYSAHHAVYRSVFASLTTLYSAEGPVGHIAESWTTNQDKTKWIIKIKPNLKFSNGDVLGPKEVVKSFTRIALLLKEKKSKDEFLDLLVGYENINSINSEIAGLVYDNESVTFNFIKPVERFTNFASFGIYGITNSKDYDESGKWIANLSPISSGSYIVAEPSLEDKKLTLKLRQDIDSFGHSSRFEKILITWDSSQKDNVDLKRGTSINVDASSAYQFSGGVETGIAYLRCQSWSHPDSICYNIENRRIIRDHIYKKMEEDGMAVLRTFFPRSIKGVSIVDSSVSNENELKTKNARLNFRNFTNSDFKFWKSLDSAILNTNLVGAKPERKDVPLKTVGKEFASGLKEYELDLCGIHTGVHVEEPDDDIRFMFRSSKGIRLPDIDGSISPLLEGKIDIQKVNQKLWDQAVIWPIANFSNGLLYKSFIDISKINLLQPPVDFNWLGSN